MTSTQTNIAHAIQQSIAEDRIVTLEASLEDVQAYAHEHGYEYDSANENDGSIDVWGWTDETPEGEQDWRLSLR